MPYDDKDEIPPTPPPLPASHPTQRARVLESAKFVGLFYLESIAGAVALLAAASVVSNALTPVPEPLQIALLVVVYVACLRRLWQRVASARKSRGQPRWSATIAFWVALTFPVAGLGYLLMEPGKLRGPQARQREAKAALGELLRAEREFFRDNGRYTLNTRELPNPGEGKVPRYVVGFPTACTVKAGVAQDKAQFIVDDPTFVQPHRLEIEAFFLNVHKADDCLDPKEGFEAYAVGSIQENAPLDIWRVDHKRTYSNLQQGW